MASHSDIVDDVEGDVLLDVVALAGVLAGLSSGRTSMGGRAASVNGRPGWLSSISGCMPWLVHVLMSTAAQGTLGGLDGSVGPLTVASTGDGETMST